MRAPKRFAALAVVGAYHKKDASQVGYSLNSLKGIIYGIIGFGVQCLGFRV